MRITKISLLMKSKVTVFIHLMVYKHVNVHRGLKMAWFKCVLNVFFTLLQTCSERAIIGRIIKKT